jgi:hypothetical protein
MAPQRSAHPGEAVARLYFASAVPRESAALSIR